MAATKQKAKKALPAAGAEPFMSAKIGGVSNKVGNPSEKKIGGATARFNKGGKVISTR